MLKEAKHTSNLILQRFYNKITSLLKFQQCSLILPPKDPVSLSLFHNTSTDVDMIFCIPQAQRCNQ